jgi:hypothetical protein
MRHYVVDKQPSPRKANLISGELSTFLNLGDDMHP